MNPIISVVIPTYNRKNLVLEAIQSALQQEPKNFEIIIVDDGSTDGTVEFLKSQNLSSQIIEKENGGISSARNAGIKSAKGKYIAFLDSDDLWLPEILKTQLEYLESNPSVYLVYTDQYMESEGKRLDVTRFTADKTTPEQKTKFDKPGFITPQAPIHASAVMVRRDIFDEVGLFNEDLKIHEDTDMWNRISEKYDLGFVEKPLSIFRWEKDPEHALKPESRRLFVDEGRKYMQIYEERRKGKETEDEKEAIKESYKRIDALEKLVNLFEKKEITEEEFQQIKSLIFKQSTPYPEINQILLELLLQIKSIFGEKMVGLYLYGSLVTGDFDIEISDIDLLCAVSSDADSSEFEKLKTMHKDFAKTHKAWNDRIEVQYLSLYGLKTFKSQTTQMVDISPGEQIHILDAGKEWLVNWYMVQEKGLTLFGASPKIIIDPISKDEFIETVREHTKIWRGKDIPKRRGSQAYAILTLCRAYYTIKNGEQVPKREAASSIQKEFPQWSSLIQNALQWRDEQWENQTEDETVYPQTVEFVNFMIDQIDK